VVPQSLSNVLVHLIFSTKARRPFIDPDLRRELHPYMAQTLANLGCPVLRIGGTADHVHILLNLSRTMTLAQAVEKVKTSSSKWAGERLEWQSGYGAFSVGVLEVDVICGYIDRQEEHHRRVSFQDEFRSMCEEFGVPLDEQYAWD